VKSEEIIEHVLAWCKLLGEVAGLPPSEDGVSSLSAARRRS
jgi:hypothetical protein